MAAPPPRLAAQCGYLRPVLVSPSASDRRIRKRHSVCKSEHMLMHKALATQRTGSYRFALRCPRKAPVNHSNPPDIIAHPTPTHTSSVSRHKALALGLCPASFSAPYYTVHLHICTGVLAFLIGAITSPPCSIPKYKQRYCRKLSQALGGRCGHKTTSSGCGVPIGRRLSDAKRGSAMIDNLSYRTRIRQAR